VIRLPSSISDGQFLVKNGNDVSGVTLKILSQLLVFLQAGVGAVQRTIQSKLREVVSVKDFGAVGDGTTDDTAAIQAALDAQQSAAGRLFVPTGTYLVTGLTIYSNIELVGESRFNSTLLLKSGTNAAVIKGTSVANVVISNLGIDGNKANQSGAGDTNHVGIHFSVSATDCKVEFCRIVDTYQQGVRFDGGSGNVLLNSLITNARSQGVRCGTPNGGSYGVIAGNIITGGSGWFPLGISLDGCSRFIVANNISNSKQSGIDFYKTKECLVIGNVCNENTVDGFSLDDGTGFADQTVGSLDNSIIVGNVFQFNDSYGLDFAASLVEGLLIVGNQLSSNTTNPLNITAPFETSCIVALNSELEGWSAATPTPTPQTGAFTSATAATKNILRGKTVCLTGKVAVADNGTGANSVIVPLPYTAASNSIGFIGSGRGDVVSGKALQVRIASGGSALSIWDYTGSYPAASGETLIFSITYEAA